VLFIHSGRIHLGNQAGGVVQALLVEDGRVVATGPDELLRQRLPEGEYDQIDLKGAVAVPGLQDAHAHLERLGAALEQLDLSRAASYEELVQLVAGAAEGVPKGTWIFGRGWDEQLWEGAQLPTHGALSLALPDNPVLLERAGGHAVLVNQRALALAGLDGVLEQVPKIEGGRVLVDDQLQASGVLLDNAIELVRDELPQPDRQTRERRLLAAQDYVLARGITCVQDMGVTPETVEIYESLLERGLLKLRIVAYLAGNAGLSKSVLEDFPRRPGLEQELSVPGVYFRLDGDLATRGAALLADYSDAPGERGYMLLSEERLTLLVHEAWQAGLQPAIGAVGDRANRVALDVFERMLQVDDSFGALRPRIEHAQVISPRDIPRFPEHGIVPSMQPANSLSNDVWLGERLGQNRARGAFAWRSLAPGWMQLAFGSGFPDEDADPLRGVFAARTRRGPDTLSGDDLVGAEHLDGAGALAGFTRGAAWAVHQEKQRGQLLPGFWADLTVYDTDPIEALPEQLGGAHVLLSVINGRVAFRR